MVKYKLFKSQKIFAFYRILPTDRYKLGTITCICLGQTSQGNMLSKKPLIKTTTLDCFIKLSRQLHLKLNLKLNTRHQVSFDLHKNLSKRWS